MDSISRAFYVRLAVPLPRGGQVRYYIAVSPVWTAGFGYVAGALIFRGSSMSDAWIESWLGSVRFERYLSAADGDRNKALELYEWNVTLGQALMHDIAHFEIAMRNAYDSAISSRWDGSAHWLLDPESPAVIPIWRIKREQSGLKRGSDVNYLNRRNVDSAIRKCGGVNATSGKVIAELSFGFWRQLTASSHEKSLWVPYLHHAYTRGTQRKDVHEVIGNINAVRNRIAHHEPIYDRVRVPAQEPMQLYTDLMNVLQKLSPDVYWHVESTSTVITVIGKRP